MIRLFHSSNPGQAADSCHHQTMSAAAKTSSAPSRAARCATVSPIGLATFASTPLFADPCGLSAAARQRRLAQVVHCKVPGEAEEEEGQGREPARQRPADRRLAALVKLPNLFDTPVEPSCASLPAQVLSFRPCLPSCPSVLSSALSAGPCFPT